MPCELIIENNTAVGFVCRRTQKRAKIPPCYKCGQPSTKLCDFRDFRVIPGKDATGKENSREYPSLSTCDRPMCNECARHARDDIDYCAEHSSELAILRSRHADELYQEQLRQLEGMEDL